MFGDVCEAIQRVGKERAVSLTAYSRSVPRRPLASRQHLR